MENYESVLSWMLSQLPMYQKKGAQAYRPDLSKMEDFCKYLQYPQHNIKTIHIAGTNGKGSTTHMMASVLQEHGLKVGMYISPHLKDFRERIQINGKYIDKEYVVEFVKDHCSYFDSHSLSFFEMTVGMAFSYFSDKEVDFAIIEVGMGGRLDGTNLITPELSIITNVGLDHTQFLGDNLETIATEKAGIIKPRTPVIIGSTQLETQSVFRMKAKEMESKIIYADQQDTVHYESDLKGNYQKQNIQTIVTGLKNLKGFEIDEEKLKQGLMNVVSNTGIQGRWQILNHSPVIVADLAHNKEGLQYVIPQLMSYSYNQLHIVLGFVKDKAVDEILKLFPLDARYYLCAAKIPRSLDVKELGQLAHNLNLDYLSFPSVERAYLEAKNQAKDNDLIYIGGSTFVIAEIL